MQLSYDGAPYSGWQIQPGVPTVQEALERALGMLLRTPTPVTGAGRTDAGVNAATMIAHFDAQPMDTKQLEEMARRVSAICQPAIAVQAIWPVPDDAHARFDATSRTYRYFVHTVNNPFVTRFSWRTGRPLDFEAMNSAAQGLLGERDFTSFAKLHADTKTNICTVTRAAWVPMDSPGRWYFEVSANRFLRNMVRAMVGTLVDVGRGKMTAADVQRILEAKNRCDAGTSMPGNALFLWHVGYPAPLQGPFDGPAAQP